MAPLKPARLQYLYEAVRQGTVRAAADSLGVAPSAVSRQIAKLEAELGVGLLERHRRGVVPTEAGELLLDHYRQQQAQQEALQSRLQALRGLRGGHVSLAVGEGFVGDLMAGAMRDFVAAHPQLTVDIQVAGTGEVVRRVLADEAHLGLLYHAPPEPKLRVQAGVCQPLCAVVAPDHPLSRRGLPLRLSELRDQPLATMVGAYGIRQLLDEAERAERWRFAPLMTSNSIAVLKHFARAGLGVALLPGFVVAVEEADGVLTSLPLRHPVLEAAEAQLVTRLGRELPPGAARLLQRLRQRMQAFRRHDDPV